MSIETLELVAGLAVAAVLTIPAVIARRFKHGEARFDENGKLIEDE